MIALPRAHGGPAGQAVLRAAPEDFIVREWLGFEADGEGDHMLLTVRKRDANTLWVAKQLARLARIPPRDVGFAGLKDRGAVADQAFTLPRRSALGDNWAGVSGEGFEVLAAQPHRRKLKRGALRGNDFELVLRHFEGDLDVLAARLTAIQAAGAPNYFGPQRFGRDGQNLELARAWFSGGEPPADRAQRGFALSAARAAIFNDVLAARIENGTWNHLQPGELVNLDGSGSVFAIEETDEVLEDRCRRLDVHPTGPLWNGTQAGGAVAVLENEIANRHPALIGGLAREEVEPQRRALRVRVAELTWAVEGQDVRLRFRLGRGAFATAVVRELVNDEVMSDGVME